MYTKGSLDGMVLKARIMNAANWIAFERGADVLRQIKSWLNIELVWGL